MKTAQEPACAWRARYVFAVVASLFLLGGCSKAHRTNLIPLDSAGMHGDTIEQLHKYQVTDDEVRQILIVGRAGMTEQGCVELVGIARARNRAFAQGDAIAGLLSAGVNEKSVIEIVRLDEVTLFAGEAAAMRLAGLSDEVVMNVARRRARGQSVIAGARLAELRDAGYSNVQLVALLDQGITDKQAVDAITRHNYAVGGHAFVRQHGRRR
jgi:hypothetical protein